MSAVEALTTTFAGYGYRRVAAQLKREGHYINRKRVLRLMRENGLLCRLRKRWVQTIDSAHGLQVWPNLLRQECLRATALDQIWVSDITYVRLGSGFCYVAAV